MVHTFTAKSQLKKKLKLALYCKKFTPSGKRYLSLNVMGVRSLKRNQITFRALIKNTIVEMPLGNVLDPSSRTLSGPNRSKNTKEEVELSKVLLFTWTREKIIERLSMTFTANSKRQKWNFCRLSSALCKVKLKYLYLLWIVRDTFLFLCDFFKDYKKRIKNQK